MGGAGSDWTFDYHLELLASEGFMEHRNKFYAILYSLQSTRIRLSSTSSAQRNRVEYSRFRYWQNEFRIENDRHYGFKSKEFWFCHVKENIRTFDRSKLKPIDDKQFFQKHKKAFASALTIITANGIEMDEEEERQAELLLKRPYLEDIRNFDVFGELKYTWNMAGAICDERSARIATNYRKEKKIDQRINMQVHRHGRCMNAIEGYGMASGAGHVLLRDCGNYRLKTLQDDEERLRQWKIQVLEDRLKAVILTKRKDMKRYLSTVQFDANARLIYDVCCKQAAAKGLSTATRGEFFVMSDNHAYRQKTFTQLNYLMDCGADLDSAQFIRIRHQVKLVKEFFKNLQ